MAKTFSNKELRKLILGFEQQNCQIKELRDGVRVLPPRGQKPLTIHLTLSDNRGVKNLRADAKRVGLFWPLD